MIELLFLISPYAFIAMLGGGLVAWIEGKDLAVAHAKGDLTTLQAKVSGIEARAARAEQVASSNEDKARRLDHQGAVDAAAFDRRIAAVRDEDEQTARAREAIGRAEGVASVVCPSPEAPMQAALRGDVRRPVPVQSIPPQIQAAIDALTSNAKAAPRRHR